MRIIFIFLLSVSVLAQTYTIKKDKNLSQILIDKGLIQSNLELQKVKGVLDENDLDWESVKKLPPGHTFTANSLIKNKNVTDLKRDTNLNSLDQIKYYIELRALNQELRALGINNNQRTLYSAFSQELSAGVELPISTDFYLFNSLGLTHAQYVDSDEQKIEETSYRLTHDFRSGFKYQGIALIDIIFALNHFSQNYFTLGQNYQTSFSKTSEIGNVFMIEGSISKTIKMGFSTNANITSDDLDNYFRYNLHLNKVFDWNKTSLTLGIIYSDTQFTINNEDFAQRDLSLSLTKRFE